MGDGATAATELEKYAAAMQGRTGIHAKQAVKKGAAPDVKSSNRFFLTGYHKPVKYGICQNGTEIAA